MSAAPISLLWTLVIIIIVIVVIVILLRLVFAVIAIGYLDVDDSNSIFVSAKDTMRLIW